MKKEMTKRILSIMLSLALIFTMMPMVPGAVETAHAGEWEICYECKTENAFVCDECNKCVTCENTDYCDECDV